MSKLRVMICDLDGVVWLAHHPIEGSVEAVARLRREGIDVVFATNNSFSTRAQQERSLADIGIPAQGRVLTSAMSAASIVESTWRVLVCGGRGLAEELSCVAREVIVAHDRPGESGPFDAVVVGMHREFNYQVLEDACRAVLAGAVLIGSNADSTYPTRDGLVPGGGSILAAIATASGRTPVVTGKPNRPMAEMVLAMFDTISPTEMLMVGDRIDTDGEFAAAIGCDFALVLSGVSTAAPSALTIPSPIHVSDSLSALVDRLLE